MHLTIVGAANIETPGRAPGDRERLSGVETAGLGDQVDATPAHLGH
jgi:hypothetical protein